jgi:hypothetical protein
MTLLRMSSRKKRSLPLWNSIIAKKPNLNLNTSIQNEIVLDPLPEVLSQNPVQGLILSENTSLPCRDGFVSEESSESEVSFFEEPSLDSQGKKCYLMLFDHQIPILRSPQLCTKVDCSGKRLTVCWKI